MDRKEVLDALITVHQELQTRLQGNASQVTAATCPLGGLEGFDSQAVPTAVRQVARKLKVVLPEGQIENFYVSEDGKTRLSLTQVADRLTRVFANCPRRDSE